MEIPKTPFVFTKQSTSANGPYDPIHWSEESKALDYEGELGVVIGKRCRHVSVADAPSVIAGFCIVNDVSVRDWQLRGKPSSFTMGKSWDTHCPMGPAIVTPDKVARTTADPGFSHNQRTESRIKCGITGEECGMTREHLNWQRGFQLGANI